MNAEKPVRGSEELLHISFLATVEQSVRTVALVCKLHSFKQWFVKLFMCTTMCKVVLLMKKQKCNHEA